MADNMDVDMDIDIVVDEEEDEELAQLRAQAEAARAQADDPGAAMVTTEDGELPEEGEIQNTDIVANKVFISGLDLLNTNDIRNFVSDHYTLDSFKRVEWINDSTANLVFQNDEIAAAALQALAAEDYNPDSDTVTAKLLTTHPNAQLRVRLSTAQDVKLPGAKDRSRFYLLNPEFDPDLRPRNGKRRPRRDERGNEGSKRRRNDDFAHSRRSSTGEESFNVDLYDDDGGAKAEPVLSASTMRPRRDQDLFATKQTGRLRDRSASPAADGDGKYGFEEKHPYRRTARRRSISPYDRRNGRSPRRGQELFPSKNGTATRQTEDNAGRELFPNKLHGGNVRGSHPDQVADLMHRSSFSNSTSHDRPSTTQKRDLFSRITGGPGTNANKDLSIPTNRNGRLSEQDTEGFSILGASKDRVENPLVKELFPLKVKPEINGQDLFDGRVKGRATQRRRAEDLFG